MKNIALTMLVVIGNIALLYYAVAAGRKAIKSFRSGGRTASLWQASVCCAITGCAVTFPLAFAMGDREGAKIAMLICLLAVIIAIWRLIRLPSVLVADVAVIGMFAAFAFSGDWMWFWAACATMVAIWFAARRAMPREPSVHDASAATWPEGESSSIEIGPDLEYRYDTGNYTGNRHH